MGFSNFPAQWEWIALIIGGVAFLMAVQPFTQAIWGNPRIEIEFNERLFDNGGEKSLWLTISNEPIYGGILKKLGVYRRTAEGLCVDFFIYDSSGKQCLVEQMRANLEMARAIYNQISLPASMTWASVDVAKTYPKGNSDILTSPEVTPIDTGLYRLYVVVTYEGHLLRRQRLFTVGNKPEGTYWVKA